MRDFSFVKTDQPTMAEFNKRFGSIADFANGIGNEYVWGKFAATHYLQVESSTSLYQSETVSSKTEKVTLRIGQDYTIDENSGIITLTGTITELKYSASDLGTAVKLNSYAGQYLLHPDNILYKITSNSTVGYSTIGTGYYISVGIVYKYVDNISYIPNGYVNSSDPNAYPVDDGYTYTPLGQLGNKVQIATGSYTGTGTYGASKPNSLTFDFAPVMVFVYDTEVSIGNANTFVAFIGATVSSGENSNNTRFYTLNKKTLSWYNNKSVTGQLNNSGTTYYYIAIG